MVDGSTSTATSDSKTNYERLLSAIVESDSPSAPPGAVALVHDEQGTWQGAAGFASLMPRKAMSTDDRFRVGSVTKTFTATLVLLLVADGELRLDDTAERWVPGLLPDGERITIRQLLNHTSGLFNYTDSPAFGRELEREALRGTDLTLTPQETIALALKEHPYFEPGTSWKYSNTNYQVLGLIVEGVTGQSFGEALAERILGPLDLRDTSLEPGVISGPHAHGYVLADGPQSLPGGRPLDVSDASLGAWADGALVSDVDDLATFFGALGDGKLLPQSLLTTMLAPTKEVPYGLGISRSVLRCGPAWDHGGEIIGYVTTVLASPDGNRIVVVAANGLSQGGITEAVDAADFFCPF